MLRIPLFAMVVLAGGLWGCGSNEFAVAPVTGKVTCQGKPVTEASITFSPFSDDPKAKAGKAAEATLNDKGEFALNTYGNRDGATIGKHHVTVIMIDSYKKNDCAEPREIILEVKSGSNHFDIELANVEKK
jgi:hypothetical protein